MLQYLSLDIIPAFLKAHIASVPRGTFSENRSLLGTDNVHGQISEGIFAPSLSSAHTKEIIINSKGTKIVKDEKKNNTDYKLNDTLKSLDKTCQNANKPQWINIIWAFLWTFFWIQLIKVAIIVTALPLRTIEL